VYCVSIDETSSYGEQSREVRRRRAAVLGGVGLVWAAFMAALGLFLFAGIVLLAAAVGAVWLARPRLPRAELPRVDLPRLDLPRVDLRKPLGSARVFGSAVARHATRASRWSATQARSGGGVAARSASAWSRRGLAASRAAGASAAHSLASTSSVAAERIGTGARWPRKKRRDPRIDQALVTNSEGVALAKAGKHAEAIDAFDQALALLADTGDRHHEGQVLANLGTVHRKVGGDEAARFCWAKALERLEPGTPESKKTAELLGVR
jgi:tetratricopeptide (TPR) repeat protein